MTAVLETRGLGKRDAVAASALRGALSAIGNAEAVPAEEHRAVSGGPHFAGAVSGLGAAEVARLVLSAADVEAIVRAEIGEREQAAGDYLTMGLTDQAARLHREASMLRSVLRESLNKDRD